MKMGSDSFLLFKLDAIFFNDEPPRFVKDTFCFLKVYASAEVHNLRNRLYVSLVVSFLS